MLAAWHDCWSSCAGNIQMCCAVETGESSWGSAHRICQGLRDLRFVFQRCVRSCRAVSRFGKQGPPVLCKHPGTDCVDARHMPIGLGELPSWTFVQRALRMWCKHTNFTDTNCSSPDLLSPASGTKPEELRSK